MGKLPVLLLLVGVLTACSVKRTAVDIVGNAISGGAGSYASDDDPELIREALPFGLKTYESLLEVSPEHQALLLSAARGYTAYQPVEKGVIDRVSRHGEAYRGEGGFAILRDDEDDLNDQDGSSGRNKHEQGANSARHGLLRGAGADELAHQQR